jgi:hypothetical protein
LPANPAWRLWFSYRPKIELFDWRSIVTTCWHKFEEVIPLLASGSMIIDLELRNVLAQLSRRHRRRFKLYILVKYAERLN